MSNYSAHCFSVALATKLGLHEAIIAQHFHHWHTINASNESMQRDGRTWFFLSAARIQQVFPYLTERKIRTAIDHLAEAGYIERETSQGYNRSIWYSLTDTGLALFGETSDAFDEMSNPSYKMSNGFDKTATSIDSNKDSIKNIEHTTTKVGRFTKPTLDEVKAYADERMSSVDADTFFAYYESNGWRVGKNPMKDWKAAFRYWEKSEAKKSPKSGPRKESTFEKNLRTIDRMFGTDYHNNYYGNGNGND